MMTQEERHALAKHLISKAKETFEAAVILRDNDSYLSASNRLYYAVFYAANAVLVLKGLFARKHTGVKSLFSKEFVNKGLIEEKYGKIFKDVMIIRQDADYNIFYVVDKLKVDRNFGEVEEFINYMDRFIDGVIEGQINF